MKKDLLDRVVLLADRFRKIEPNLNLDERRAEIKEQKSEIESPDFWNDPDRAQKISQKCARDEKFVASWSKIADSLATLPELLEIAENSELADLETEIDSLENEFREAEIGVFLSGEYDDRDAILSIFVGTGGQDAEDFAKILLRMYLRFAEQRGFRAKILNESASDAGIRSATIEISGDFAYGFLKSEHGVHRLIRLSPFNAKSLRQTSFARVEVTPSLDDSDTSDIEIADSDLRIDVFRSSGAGGQSVNTTDSAVRITFLPLEISVSCQNERSQLQNKINALKILKSRLALLRREQHAEKISELRGEIMENSFGSQIRTYTLQPYKLVKDHRTGAECSDPEKVFDGDLTVFVEEFLRKGNRGYF